jgi:xanthine dehydrogenase accessory factor
MSFDAASLRAAVLAHGAVARVLVAAVEGSVPREPGAAMLVWTGGQSGTIGGGALEFEAARRAREALNQCRDRIDRAPLGPALGQCCGGAVTLLTEVWTAARLDGVAGDVVARPVPGGPAQTPLAVTRLLAAARNRGARPDPILKDGWMVEPLAQPARAVWIWGAGHVGRAIATALAPLPVFEITWVDTAADRFPACIPEGVSPLVATDPADAAIYAPAHAEHLILTYSHALDLELCHRLLAHGFAACGLIGSRTKWARFRSRLSALGHSDASMSRIRCPIGDPSLGKHPQAIAVSVAHELLRNGEKKTAWKDGTG